MPKFIVFSEKFGFNSSGPYRLAQDEEHVIRIISGLRGRYGADTKISVFRLSYEDATAEFI